MDDIVVKTCVSCNTQKHIETFYSNFSECKECNNERVLQRYFYNKVEILQKRRNENARFKDLDNRLKELEEKLFNFKLTTWVVNNRVM